MICPECKGEMPEHTADCPTIDPVTNMSKDFMAALRPKDRKIVIIFKGDDCFYDIVRTEVVGALEDLVERRVIENDDYEIQG